MVVVRISTCSELLVHFFVLFDVRNDDVLQGDDLIREQDFNVFCDVRLFAKF